MGGRVAPSVAALVLIAACTNASPATTAIESGPSTSGTLGTGGTSTGTGPEVPPIDTCSLLTLDEVDAALGLLALPLEERGIFTFDRGEACVWSHDAGEGMEGASVAITPGHPDDFRPEADLNGVEGMAVSEVGGAAVWFGGEEGTLSIAEVSSLGYLFFRISLTRPDLDDTARLEVAKEVAAITLPRFPGMEAPPSEPALLTFEPEVPDRSQSSFVDQLLAREEAGEWSRGEGLVAILKMFAGETAAAALSLDPDVADLSGTGIIALSREYLLAGGDETAKTEIARLLDLLLLGNQPPTAKRIDPVTVLATADLVALGPTAQTEEGCGLAESEQPGWVAIPVFEDVGQGPFQLVVFWPAPGQLGGWNQDTHLTWALEAMEKSAELYGAEALPCVHLLVSHHGGSYTYVLDDLFSGTCGVFVNRPMQIRVEAHFKQQIAADVAHCLLAQSFPEQYGVASYLQRRWWNHALAWYLSNEVYPNPLCGGTRCDLEWRLSGALSAQELGYPLVKRADPNWLFFQYLSQEVGNEAIGEIIESLPPSGDPAEHEARLADFKGMDELFHDFVKGLTDVSIEDSGGGLVPYQPMSIPVPLDHRFVLLEEPEPFESNRWHLAVEEGKYACFQTEETGGVLASIRPGGPGSVAGGWFGFADEPDVLSGEAVVVVTATAPGSEFTLNVTDLVDDPNDCERKAPESSSDPCQLAICGPSEYYHLTLPEWLNQVLPPLEN